MHLLWLLLYPPTCGGLASQVVEATHGAVLVSRGALIAEALSIFCDSLLSSNSDKLVEADIEQYLESITQLVSHLGDKDIFEGSNVYLSAHMCSALGAYFLNAMFLSR
jgi:hypothetical protein